MSDFDAQIKDKVDRKAELSCLLRVATSRDYQAFLAMASRRKAEIVKQLETEELSPYDLGKLQGRLKELGYCVLDSSAIERESQGLQREIDRLSGRQAKRAIKDAMKPVDPRRGR